MRSSPLQLLKEHTSSKYFPSVGEKFFGVLVHGFLRFLRIALIRASLLRVLPTPQFGYLRVLPTPQFRYLRVLTMPQYFLNVICGLSSSASCRRFSTHGFAQPLGSSAASRISSRPGRRRRTSHGRGMRQTLEGSFSAVSKPNFARKYALESSRRDLHNALLCTALQSQFFVKILPKFFGIFARCSNFHGAFTELSGIWGLMIF